MPGEAAGRLVGLLHGAWQEVATCRHRALATPASQESALAKSSWAKPQLQQGLQASRAGLGGSQQCSALLSGGFSRRSHPALKLGEKLARCAHGKGSRRRRKSPGTEASSA